ncbi:MAG: peptidylprolyl isomerase [Myxococcales bacterium]|nr:MAG: peptidylprolyl isomerase [Myxococcales bacterium]
MSAKEQVIQEGSTVTIELDVHTSDGELISSSAEDGPLTFVMGQKQVVPGLERSLSGLKPGDPFNVTLEPNDAYGDYNEDGIEVMPRDAFGEEIVEGEDYFFEDESGGTVIVTVVELVDEGVVVDFNHPLAGETLRFKGKILEIG